METELINQNEILSQLNYFSGSENWYKIPLSVYNYTDGIKSLIDNCRCYWLVSDLAIELTIKKINKPFILVRIEIKDNKALITLREDSNLKPFLTKRYTYTDFPLSEYEFYIEGNTFLLKGEH